MARNTRFIAHEREKPEGGGGGRQGGGNEACVMQCLCERVCVYACTSDCVYVRLGVPACGGACAHDCMCGDV